MYEDIQTAEKKAIEDAKSEGQKAEEAAQAAMEAERERIAEEEASLSNTLDDVFAAATSAAQTVEVRDDKTEALPGAMNWEVGRTKVAKTRTDAPATFGNMYS